MAYAQLVDTRDWPGLPPTTSEKTVLVWGTSRDYRKSDVYLACCPLDDIDAATMPGVGYTDGDPATTTWSYFTGVDGDGNPHWSPKEVDAVALFLERDTSDMPGIGELSVTYERTFGVWVMLYNFPSASDPNGSENIHMRYASTPWGPWGGTAPAAIIFDAQRDGAYGTMLHVGGDGFVLFQDTCGPCSSGVFGCEPGTYGAIYAPYLIGAWTKVTATTLTLYYALSTWRPYQTVVMRTTLDVACVSPTGLLTVAETALPYA